MKLLALTALSAGLLLPATRSATAPAPASSAPVHCQIPCGIYGDKMRIEMMLEDLATIRKGMAKIQEIESLGEAGNRNQIVRWVMNKDQHAQAIQDQVASYWLAQRIKAPKEDSVEAQQRYHRQLAALHRITVSAMKCKQTVDVAHAKDLREAAGHFSKMYFSEEDLKHLEEHLGVHDR